jgi:D-alanine transaminase
MNVVFLNGAYLPREEAAVPVDDRGFLFADGVYEVTPAYRGRWFRLERHVARMRDGLAALHIDYDPTRLVPMHDEMLERNGLSDVSAAIVYVQVTRGVAPRTHAFPDPPVEPTVYAFAKEYVRPSFERWEQGFRAVTVPDRRWSRVDIKSIALLPNVLAQQAAVDAGVDDAIFVKDGCAIEGAHNNFFGVFGGTLVTYPRSNLILPGITRDFVIELAHEIGVPVDERPILVEELRDAEELFTTGTTTEVRPLVEVDGHPVGTGAVGPVSRRLFEAFVAHVNAVIEDVAAD